MGRDSSLNGNLYDILGVSETATPQEIKATYRKLAKELHPDTNPDPSTSERFKKINEAYDILSDESKREQYNQLTAQMKMGARTGSGGWHTSANLSDLIEQFNLHNQPGSSSKGDGPSVEDLFANLFNNHTFTTERAERSNRATSQGGSVESEIVVSFHEAYDGATLPLRLNLPHRVCTTCSGSGLTLANSVEQCLECHGSGHHSSHKAVNVKLPQGVRDGQRIRVKGEGVPSYSGGPPGDLYITVLIEKHPVFERKDNDVTVTIPITFDEAVLGSNIKVPLPKGGTVTLKIPSSTNSGTVFRVPGEGFKGRHIPKGDLLVTVTVHVPHKKDVTEEMKQVVSAYRDVSRSHNPRDEIVKEGGRGK